jgi:hypothetical protein
VFPCRPGTDAPAVRDWEARATRDPGRIWRAWRTAPFNVGVPCGPARLVVLHLAVPNPGAGVASGLDLLDALARRHGARLPLGTYTTGHPDGAVDLYYTTPPGLVVPRSAGRLARRITVHAAGGFVLAAGSVQHADVLDPAAGRAGGVVELFDDAPAAPLPAWLARLLATTTDPVDTVAGLADGEHIR